MESWGKHFLYLEKDVHVTLYMWKKLRCYHQFYFEIDTILLWYFSMYMSFCNIKKWSSKFWRINLLCDKKLCPSPFCAIAIEHLRLSDLCKTKIFYSFRGWEVRERYWHLIESSCWVTTWQKASHSRGGKRMSKNTKGPS